jgi:hypothetical protein
MIDPQLTAILARALRGGGIRPLAAGMPPHHQLAQMPTAAYPNAPHLMPGRPVTALDHHANRIARDALASWHTFASRPPGHPSME